MHLESNKGSNSKKSLSLEPSHLPSTYGEEVNNKYAVALSPPPPFKQNRPTMTKSYFVLYTCAYIAVIITENMEEKTVVPTTE